MKLLSKLGILASEGLGNIALNVGGSINISAGSKYLIDGIDLTTQFRPKGYRSASLSADVALSTANTFYNGPQVTLDEVGLWLLLGTAVVRQATTGVKQIEARLYGSDSTVIASGSATLISNNPAYVTIPLIGWKVITGPSRTVTLQAASSVGSTSVFLTVRNAITSNNGTVLYAFKMEV